MIRALVHPRMVSGLKNFYPQTCTIQSPGPERSAHGQKQPEWTDLANHIAIPCRRAAGGGSETRTVKQTFTVRMPSIALKGYFPEITTKMRAVVDGSEICNIVQVRHDAQQASTSLDVEVVS